MATQGDWPVTMPATFSSSQPIHQFLCGLDNIPTYSAGYWNKSPAFKSRQHKCPSSFDRFLYAHVHNEKAAKWAVECEKKRLVLTEKCNKEYCSQVSHAAKLSCIIAAELLRGFGFLPLLSCHSKIEAMLEHLFFAANSTFIHNTHYLEKFEELLIYFEPYKCTACQIEPWNASVRYLFPIFAHL